MARILIVEDNQIVQDFLALTLSEEGYDVACASDGPSGLELAKKRLPDAVVLDLHLPTMNGDEVLRALKVMAPSLPVFIYSSFCDFPEVVGGLQGATGCFVKSGNLSPLLGAIEETIGSSGGGRGRDAASSRKGS